MERVITSSNHFLGLRVYFVIFTLFSKAIIQNHYIHVVYMHKIKVENSTSKEMVSRNYSDDPRIANYNKNRFLVAS